MITARKKVLDLQALALLISDKKKRGEVVGHCHGCFDILHFGHLRHFEYAKSLVDFLVVTVTPDRFVNKGPNRPVFPEDQRAELVGGLAAVDAVAINQWDSAVETIGLLKPTLFIKGQEYETRAMEVNPNFLKEKNAIEAVGGKVAFTYEKTSSSTAAFKRLQLS